MASCHASVQWAAVRITTLSASICSRLPLQLMRARLSASTIPRTDTTFGYSLLTSGVPQVMAAALDAVPSTTAATTDSPTSSFLIPIRPPCRCATPPTINQPARLALPRPAERPSPGTGAATVGKIHPRYGIAGRGLTLWAASYTTIVGTDLVHASPTTPALLI